MTAFERIERIRLALRLAGWLDKEPSLFLNQWRYALPAAEPLYGNKYGSEKHKGDGKWIATYAGLSGSGETPEDAAEALEAVVFEAFRGNIDERIQEAQKKSVDLFALKTQFLQAAGQSEGNEP